MSADPSGRKVLKKTVERWRLLLRIWGTFESNGIYARQLGNRSARSSPFLRVSKAITVQLRVVGTGDQPGRIDETRGPYASLDRLRRARSLWAAGTMNRATPNCVGRMEAVPIATRGRLLKIQKVFFDIPRPSALRQSESLPAEVRARESAVPGPRWFEGSDWLGILSNTRS